MLQMSRQFGAPSTYQNLAAAGARVLMGAVYFRRKHDESGAARWRGLRTRRESPTSHPSAHRQHHNAGLHGATALTGLDHINLF